MRNDNVIESREQEHTSQQNKYYVGHSLFKPKEEKNEFRRSYENVLRVYFAINATFRFRWP